MNTIPIIRGSFREAMHADGSLRFSGKRWPDGEEVVLRELSVEDSRDLRDLETTLDDLRPYEKEEFLNSCGGASVAPEDRNQVFFTTAPQVYDYGCTLTLETFTCAMYPGERPREWRKILIRGNDGFAQSQVPRYYSGIYAVIPDDPRKTCAEFAARQAKDAEDEAHLAAMTIPELEIEAERREGLSGIGTGDMRQRAYVALRRKKTAEHEAQRRAHYDALRGKIEGKTLLTSFELKEVVSIQPFHLPTEVECHSVYLRRDDGSQVRMELGEVAFWVDSGMIPAKPDLPPWEMRHKLAKAGLDPLTAKLVTLGTKTFFVGGTGASFKVMDPNTGKLSRSRAVIETARAAAG